eukprot:8406429-Alexandrium_andersonii.AAC.1
MSARQQLQRDGVVQSCEREVCVGNTAKAGLGASNSGWGEGGALVEGAWGRGSLGSRRPRLRFRCRRCLAREWH